MRAAIPFVTNPIYSPDSSGFSPDGRLAYSLRNVPTYVAGQNTKDVLSTAAGVSGLTPGEINEAIGLIRRIRDHVIAIIARVHVGLFPLRM